MPNATESVQKATEQLEKHWVTGKVFLELWSEGSIETICEEIFKLCQCYESVCYTHIDKETQQRIDDTVSAIFYILTRPDFEIPAKHIPQLLAVSHLFCNLVSVSSYRTADNFIQHLLNQKDNFYKLLFVYSARCKRAIDQEILFKLCPKAATLWWMNYGTPIGAPLTELLWDNLREHYSKIPDGFTLTDARTIPAMFDCTYYNPDCDGIIKTELNLQCKKLLPEFVAVKKPVVGKILWVTSRWYSTSSVYRCSKPYLDKLAEKYDITLVVPGKPDPKMDTTVFKEQVYCPLEGNKLDITILRESLDADMAIFPDVGMSNESVIMSNLRLAPKTLCLYGHASSTFSPEMDYWMGGTELEVPELAYKHYGERLLLVKGVGMMPVYPSYERKYPERDPDRVILNCAWTGPKISWPTISALKKIINQAKTPVLIKLYPAFTLGRYNTLLPSIKDLSRMFGDELTVMAERSYDEYMKEMELGDISLMAHPFGGYTTVVDAFVLGQPVVAVEGTRMFNKMAPTMLRTVGLPQLVCKDLKSFIDTVVSLVDHPERRYAARKHLEGLDLRAKLAGTADSTDLLRTVDYIYANHDRIMSSGDRGPFFVP